MLRFAELPVDPAQQIRHAVRIEWTQRWGVRTGTCACICCGARGAVSTKGGQKRVVLGVLGMVKVVGEGGGGGRRGWMGKGGGDNLSERPVHAHLQCSL